MNMIRLGALCLASATIAAHAAGPAPAGAFGQLRVEYRYESKGQLDRRDNWAQWAIERWASINAELTAQKPGPVATLVAPDATQTAAREQKLQQATGAMQGLQPQMQAAAKIAAACGNDQACMSREVQKMGMGLSAGDVAQAQATGQKAQALAAAGPALVQLWRPKSQSGSYRIREDVQRQYADPLCTGKPGMKCRRSEQRQGEGRLPGAEGAAGATTAMVEIDHAKNTLTVLLPAWTATLPVEQTVTSDYAHDKDVGTRQVPSAWRITDIKPITVPLSASGEQVREVVDAAGFPGKLTVRWTFAGGQ